MANKKNVKEDYEKKRLSSFKDWLMDENICTTSKSAASYSSRLKNALNSMSVKIFGKGENISAIVLIDSLLIQNTDYGIKFLDALTRLAYQERNKKGKVETGSWGDCRTALNRYIAFLEEKGVGNCIEDFQQSICKKIDNFISNYNPREYAKKELQDNIIRRRTSEGRYTGNVYYPIELIIKVFNESGDENKSFMKEWFICNVNKIDLLINKEGETKNFKNLESVELCKDYTVKLKFENDTEDFKLYTRIDDDCFSLMKVATLASIHIDHKEAISKILDHNEGNNYPAFKELTGMIKGAINEKCWKEWADNNKKTYLKNLFYSARKKELEKLIPCLKNDLDKLLNNVEYEMMDGLANIIKSNKK